MNYISPLKCFCLYFYFFHLLLLYEMFYQGYALIEYENFEEAQNAITAMNGGELLTQTLTVDWAFSNGPSTGPFKRKNMRFVCDGYFLQKWKYIGIWCGLIIHKGEVSCELHIEELLLSACICHVRDLDTTVTPHCVNKACFWINLKEKSTFFKIMHLIVSKFHVGTSHYA